MLHHVLEAGLIDPSEIFIDGTHIKAAATNHKYKNTVEAGTIHDSQAFPVLFAKLEPFSPEFIIADSGYKTPSIAKFLLEKEITPVFPYTRPRVREAFYVLKTLSMTSILTAIFVQRTRY